MSKARGDAALKKVPWATGEPDPLRGLSGTDLTTAQALLGSGKVRYVSYPDATDLQPIADAPTGLGNIIKAYETKFGDRQLVVYHDGDIGDITFTHVPAYMQTSGQGANRVYYTMSYTVPATVVIGDLNGDGDTLDEGETRDGVNPDKFFIAWGGHIAVGYDGDERVGDIKDDWGRNMGAGTGTGADYHVRLEDWTPNGNVGNQDNQVMASAVISPGVKFGHKFIDPDGDGVWDPGELGAGDWVIHVKAPSPTATSRTARPSPRSRAWTSASTGSSSSRAPTRSGKS